MRFSFFILHPSAFILYDPFVRTLAHLSDIHFDLVDPAVVEALVRDLNQHPPDLLIVSGDLTQRARVGQFRQAMAFLDRLPKPQMVLAGNHDVPLFNVFRRVFAPMGRFQRYATEELMPVHQDEALLVIGLNTAGRGSLRPNGFWKDGRVGDRQLDRAITRLREAPSRVAKVLVTHHPFIAHDEAHADDVVRNGQAVLERLKGLGVHLLLAGHLHHAFHAEVQHGAISLQAGTACSSRRRGQPNSYNRLTIRPDATRVQVRAFDGNTFVVHQEHVFPRRAII